MGVKERKYNPNASYAERALNVLTDKLGITSPPTYTDGYGTVRNTEDARREGEKANIWKAVDSTTDALKVGAIGTSALYGGKGVVKGASYVYKQLPLWLKTVIDAGLTADGAVNLFTDNGVQKTYKEAKEGNYGKAALSGIGDALNIMGTVHLPTSSTQAIKELINWSKTNKLNLKLDPNKYYRVVSESAIHDANTSKVIRANPNSYLPWDVNKTSPKQWAGASFKKGQLYIPPDKDLRFVIEGTDNIEWIRKGIHDEIPDFNITVNRKLPIRFGDEVTPIFDNKLNNAPSHLFQYWEKGNKWYDPFWHLKKFK